MSRPARPARALAVLLVVALALSGACGEDDPEAAPSTPPAEPTTTVGGGEGSSTTEADDATTTTGPSSAGPAELRDALLGADALSAALGAELAPDPSVGTGALEPEVCEEVTLDATWEEQASQALSTGEGTEGLIVTEAVLRAADGEAAADIVEDAVAALTACLDGLGVEPEELAPGEAGGADEAVIVARSVDEARLDTVALVRVDDHVAVLTVTGPAGAGAVDAALLSEVAGALGG